MKAIKTDFKKERFMFAKQRFLPILFIIPALLFLGGSCKAKEHSPGHQGHDMHDDHGSDNQAGLQSGPLVAHEPDPLPSTKPVETKHVCMANDKYMGVDQIPVLVEGKTYYGCCAGCASKIKENQGNVRFSKDPLTGETVDKATAYIVATTDSNKALYFKSEKTYRRYLKPSR